MARVSIKSNEKCNTIQCYFCGGNHACRDCPIESAMAPMLKIRVGNRMEYWIAENFNCPECNFNTLNVIGNHTPSLDLICKNCSKKFEVKSKCLSVYKLPNDINLQHGNYIDYVQRVKEGLNLIVVIYGVSRVDKMIYVREVLYADNTDLNDSSLIEVEKRKGKYSHLSTIFIKNKKQLMKLKLDQELSLSFKKDYEYFS